MYPDCNTGYCMNYLLYLYLCVILWITTFLNAADLSTCILLGGYVANVHLAKHQRVTTPNLLFRLVLLIIFLLPTYLDTSFKDPLYPATSQEQIISWCIAFLAMEQVKYDYSHKNIAIPNREEYKIDLSNRMETFVNKLRWKAFFFFENDKIKKEEKYGFKSNKKAPAIKELAAFESDFIDLVNKIQFRKLRKPFQNKLKKDIKEINKSDKIFTKADKSGNLYKLSPKKYKKLLNDEVTKFYKKAPKDLESKLNKEAFDLACKFNIADRVEKFCKKQAFITIKDHKTDYRNNPTCRLLNPTKSQLGKISKIILQDICSTLRIATKVNQWRNTAECIGWFNEIENKNHCTFIQYDIKDFYPTINENTMFKAIKLAKEYMSIPQLHIDLINHCRKSVLYHEGNLWVKKDTDSLFDCPMGAYDGAEMCELIGIFLLRELNIHIDQSYHGIYRDDGLIVLENSTPRQGDIMRKKITKLFKDFGFEITITSNMKIVDFLDVTLNLSDGTVRPYKKPNHIPSYVNTDSNHPKNTFKHIPNGIAFRLSTNSTNEDIFKENIPIYEQALRNNGYQTNLTYKKDNTNKSKRKNRNRRVIWFNPVFNLEVKTNIGKIFFNLLNKHFPPTCLLYKIFNKNTIKISYGCMPNFISQINRHNKKLLNPNTNKDPPCNCRSQISCPLNGKCRASNIIYKATIKYENETPKEYIGSTSTTFKNRYYNHNKSFKHDKYKHETSLSTYIWNMKGKNKNNPDVTWEILKKTKCYSEGDRYCKLCTAEKFYIISNSDPINLLNKKSELFHSCIHRKEALLVKQITTNHEPP